MQTLTLALDTIRAGNYEAGLAMLTELTREPATRGEALGHRAWLLRSLGRLDEALQDYDALMGENTGDLHGAAMRADTLRLAGHPAEALAATVEILKHEPTHELATQVLIACRKDLGLKTFKDDNSTNYLPQGLPAPGGPFRPLRFPLFRMLRDKLRFPSRYDYYEHYLRTHARGKRVIDIGAMWLVDGRFSFFAEECGAAKVVAFDTMPASEKFLAETARRNSRVRFVQGDLMDPDSTNWLGQFDVVFCCGVIYHLPDPALGVQRIRALCRERAMIGTAVIGEGLTPNRAVYYPYLGDAARDWWNYGSREMKFALDTPYQPAEGYVNWFWGMSPSCVAALLHTSGLKVEHIHYRRHFAYFECKLD